MAFEFSEYLNSKANPGKGLSREFELQDVRMLAYIYTQWGDDPDIECIKIGLNRNCHFENPDIDNLIISLIPLYIEPPENLGENFNRGVIFSGMSTIADLIVFARSYKLAGDRLIDIALQNEEAWELHNPALFNYRHSIELYLKVITKTYKNQHNLLPLYDKLKELLKTKFDSSPPKWFEDIILKFNRIDPGGTTFRYGSKRKEEADDLVDEVYIDFIHLKTKMDWLIQSFQNILYRQGIRY